MSRFATFAGRGVRGAWLETIIIMPSNFKNLVRARMAKTGESWQSAARNVRAEAAVDGTAGAKPPNGSTPMPFKTFRAQGFNGLDAVDFDGPRLLDILRGPFNSRKLGLLQALDLCRFLTAQVKQRKYWYFAPLIKKRMLKQQVLTLLASMSISRK